MKIIIVTDAWKPQMNGVVRTLEMTIKSLRKSGHIIEVISPSDGYWTIPLPTYPDIKLAPFAKSDMKKRILAFQPDAIHIATEGPLGLSARSLCIKWGKPFTTSYHTKFPEYIKARFPFIPISLSYKFIRSFHNSGGCTMVTTDSMVNFLQEKKFNNLSAWARGVDISQFHPDKRFKPKDVYEGIKRPIFVNIGRVAVEKNIEAFLKIDLPGSKVVVGDGPQLNYLKEKYPEAHFLGAKFGDELSRHFADADVFVFPSKTDTFGLVIIESMATGTPVAAYPVTGPVDIIPDSKAGSINEDLRVACISCLELDRNDAVTHAEKFSWDAVSEVFYNYLTPNYKPKHQKHMFLISYVLKLILFPYNLLKK